MKKPIFTTRHITRIAILASISAVLLFINFPIMFFPGFYKIDFSEIPCLLCGFALGPISGATCVILSRVINIILEGGSETGYIGELASLIITFSFVFVSSLIYEKIHTKKGAIISLIISVIVSSLVAVLVNYYLLLPLFLKQIPDIKFVILYTFPFNIIKGMLNSIIVILLYKRISPLIKDKS